MCVCVCVHCRNAGQSHVDWSYISLNSACDKAGGVRLPGDQSGHIVYTHTNANMVDPRDREERERQGNKLTFFRHLKWQHTRVRLDLEKKQSSV